MPVPAYRIVSGLKTLVYDDVPELFGYSWVSGEDPLFLEGFIGRKVYFFSPEITREPGGDYYVENLRISQGAEERRVRAVPRKGVGFPFVQNVSEKIAEISMEPNDPFSIPLVYGKVLKGAEGGAYLRVDGLVR